MVEMVNYNKGFEYTVILINLGVSVQAVPLFMRSSERFKKMLDDELSQEMPDITQEIGKKEEFGVSQSPWQDREDFIDPQPMKKPVQKSVQKTNRFKECSENDILKLQTNSKAASTHKHTRWGVKQLRRMLFICGLHKFFIIFCLATS